MRKHSEPELRQKIDAMVEEHLNGSAFWDKFDMKVRETMDQHKETMDLEVLTDFILRTKQCQEQEKAKDWMT